MLAGAAVAGQPAQALGSSTFEEADGNLVAPQGKKDWSSFAADVNCVAPFADCAIDLPTGGGDDSLGMGSKDDMTTFQVVDGSIPNNKSDLARLYVAEESVDGVPYLYLGWVRNNTIGTANMSIEINKVRNADLPAVGKPYTINRTAGDLLVLFDFAQGGKADTLQLRLSEWVTAGAPKTVCQASTKLPCWGKTVDLTKSKKANGSVNKVAVTDVLYPEPTGGPANGLAALTFGEAAIDLRAAGVAQPCEGFGQAMLRSRASSAFNAELKDFVTPAPIAIDRAAADTSGWLSEGTARTDYVFDTQLMNPGTTLGTSAASNSKPGDATPDADQDEVLSVDLPSSPTGGVDTGGILHVDLLRSAAASHLSAAPGSESTTQTSLARAVGVNILDGLVTADVVQSVGRTSASAFDADASTALTTLKNVKVDLDGEGGNAPLVFNDVAPNTRIDLPVAGYGAGSYVALREQKLRTVEPAAGTPLGTSVAYDAYVEEVTTLIHVFVKDRTPDTLLGLFDDGDVTTEVRVGDVTAHSRSTGVLCEAAQAVEGHATVLSGNVGNLVGASLGNARLPDGGGGGADHQALESLSLGDLVSAGVATSDTSGGWSSTTSGATSSSRVAGLCLDLLPGGGCEISADVLRSDVTSTGSATSWESTGASSFVDLRVLGQQVVPNPPSTVIPIPGLGFVAVNEQVCGDGSAAVDGACSTSGPDSAMTVRALHVLVTELLPANPLGLELGSEIVIAESHSGATFVSVG